MRFLVRRSVIALLSLVMGAGCASEPAPKKTAELDQLLSEVREESGSTKAANAPVELYSEVPIKQDDFIDLRKKIEANWNAPGEAITEGLEGEVPELRVELERGGKVAKVTLLNDDPNPLFRQVAESCVRAVKISSPLPLPKDSNLSSIKLRCDPSMLE